MTTYYYYLKYLKLERILKRYVINKDSLSFDLELYSESLMIYFYDILKFEYNLPTTQYSFEYLIDFIKYCFILAAAMHLGLDLWCISVYRDFKIYKNNMNIYWLNFYSFLMSYDYWILCTSYFIHCNVMEIDYIV